MLTKLRRMGEHGELQRDRKYKKVPKRSHRAEEYSKVKNILEGFKGR